MPCIFKCDGCGSEAPGEFGTDLVWRKPSRWYGKLYVVMGKLETQLVACSSECLVKAIEKERENVRK